MPNCSHPYVGMFCYYQETEKNGNYWWLRIREGFKLEGKGNENEQFKERHIYIRERDGREKKSLYSAHVK